MNRSDLRAAINSLLINNTDFSIEADEVNGLMQNLLNNLVHNTDIGFRGMGSSTNRAFTIQTAITLVTNPYQARPPVLGHWQMTFLPLTTGNLLDEDRTVTFDNMPEGALYFLTIRNSTNTRIQLTVRLSANPTPINITSSPIDIAINQTRTLMIMPRPNTGMAQFVCLDLDNLGSSNNQVQFWNPTTSTYEAKISKTFIGPENPFSTGLNIAGPYDLWFEVDSLPDIEDLQIQLVTNLSIRLTWDYSSTSHAGFHVYRRIGTATTWSLIETLGPAARIFNDGDRPASTTHHYKIVAFNQSTFSNEALASITTGTIVLTSHGHIMALGSKLWSYWRMDDNVSSSLADSTTNGRILTVSNSAQIFFREPGLDNDAAGFSIRHLVSNNAYLRRTGLWNYTGADWEICFLARVVTNLTDRPLVLFGHTNQSPWFRLGTGTANGSHVRFFARDSDAVTRANFTISDPVAFDNTTKMYNLRYSSSSQEITIFINNVNVGSVALNLGDGKFGGITQLNIFGNDTGGGFLTGSLDRFFIVANGTLTNTERTNIFTANPTV